MKTNTIHLTVPMNTEHPEKKVPMCGASSLAFNGIDDANEFMERRMPKGFHKCPKCKAEVLSWSK